MSLKLRDLIRQVRACKTAAEERAVIAKESAMIRTAIREEQEQFRHRNVAKLLFMHMLGYPTHFGQLECMKLIASPHFPEKRIGYLGLMLLLSEEADVLMLATNSLKNDLNNPQKFIAGLSLCAIGNLATADMSRDLAPEIDKHLSNPNPYLRKKACLAMSRCLTKCPDMVEDFVDRVPSLLKDKSHGVMITVLQLMTRMLLTTATTANATATTAASDDTNLDADDHSAVLTKFRHLVPTLVKLLRSLLSMGYSPDYDVGGISDPFLQVQILTVLRLLGENNPEASEQMNDVLAQVATNTETSKNAGNAILYEAVQTIMAIPSEEGLIVLAINILGRFLLNRDNNIRYVALNTLSASVVHADIAAVQRHRSTIVECLKDPDVSIRQRALELIYHLVNEENVEMLVAELLNYLVVCEPRQDRTEICSRILQVVQTYSPSDMWRIDTLITMLTIAGRECSPDVVHVSIAYISRTKEDVRSYATHKLLTAIRDDDGTQRGLLIAGVWCIGEYADLLLKEYTYIPNNVTASNDTSQADTIITTTPTQTPVTFEALQPSAIVDIVERVTKAPTASIHDNALHQVVLTCYAKLTERLASTESSPALLERLTNLLHKHSTSHSLELQIRACEYSALLQHSPPGVADPFTSKVSLTTSKEALARMPVVDMDLIVRKQRLAARNHLGELESIDGAAAAVAPPPKPKVTSDTNHNTPAPTSSVNNNDLLDLMDIFGSGPNQSETKLAQPNGTTSTKPAASSTTTSTAKSDADLLADIFSVPPARPSVPTSIDPFLPTPQPQQPNSNFFLQQQQPTFVTPVTNIPFANNTNTPTPLVPGIIPNIASATTTTLPATVQSSDLFPSSTSTLPSKVVPAAGNPVMSAFNQDGLEILFECIKPEPSNLQRSDVVATFKNLTQETFVGVNLQCAVPKYITMEILPPSSTTVPPAVVGNKPSIPVRQTIRITNNNLGVKKLLMKLKVSFTIKGEKKEHMTTFSGFPDGF
jgi:AP-1 complex subunit gamma-1